MEWYLKVLRDYATFSGRARRKEYWMFVLVNWVVMTALVFIDRALFGDAAILFLVYFLAIALPSVAVAMRRLHDTGRSGWWLLVALVPLVGGIVFFVFMVLDSEPGENQYGPSPKPSSGPALA